MEAKKPFEGEQMTDEELIAKINDCISRGITLKYQIAKECHMTIEQLKYRFIRLQMNFPELEHQRTQRARKNQQKNFQIIKGLLEYGFSERDICQMIGCSASYLRRLVAEENNGKDIKKLPIKEMLNKPNHQLLVKIYMAAASGKTTIDEIAQELDNPQRPINKTTIESIILWLDKRKMWFSEAQLDEFRIKTQDREKKNSAMLRSYLKAAKKEEESELDTLIGSAEDSELKARKKSTKSVPIKRREAFLDYVCDNKYIITTILENSTPEKKKLFFDEIVDMMDINSRLVNSKRVEKLTKIAGEVCGLKYALNFLRHINSNLFEQDEVKLSEQLDPIKQNLYRQIVLEHGGELRKQGFSDEQIAKFMRTHYQFRVAPNDVLFILGEVQNEQEQDRD